MDAEDRLDPIRDQSNPPSLRLSRLYPQPLAGGSQYYPPHAFLGLKTPKCRWVERPDLTIPVLNSTDAITAHGYQATFDVAIIRFYIFYRRSRFGLFNQMAGDFARRCTGKRKLDVHHEQVLMP